uniref:Uncharacterized protein n=1 Tax=Arundo donax TaxID=35708 RepID=A0A0A8XRH2_ARUDO
MDGCGSGVERGSSYRRRATRRRDQTREGGFASATARHPPLGRAQGGGQREPAGDNRDESQRGSNRRRMDGWR